MKRKNAIHTVISDGVIYIRTTNCGIAPLFLLIDGIQQHGFKGDKHCYLAVDDAIAWHRKEASFSPSPLRLAAIEKLESLKLESRSLLHGEVEK